jgi:hypothetical protein
MPQWPNAPNRPVVESGTETLEGVSTMKYVVMSIVNGSPTYRVFDTREEALKCFEREKKKDHVTYAMCSQKPVDAETIIDVFYRDEEMNRWAQDKD